MANDGEIDREFLAQIPIFGGLPDRMLETIAAAARMVRVAPGTQVIGEGEPPSNIFVVCAGELEICKRGANGAEFCLATLHRGDCVGEMSLIDIQPRSATVRAVGEAVLFTLEHAEVARLYRTDLEVYTLLVMNIAREISRRLRLADQVLVDMGVAVQDLWSDVLVASSRRNPAARS